MNSLSFSTKLACGVLLPTRIITIITLLALVPVFNISWEIATIIFQGFLPIYIASFFIEGILSRNGFIKNFESIGSKYVMALPLEFVGVASFALMSFSTKPDEIFFLGIQISAIIIASSLFVEWYHYKAKPRLSKIKLSHKQEILSVVGITISTVFLVPYFWSINPLG